MPKSTQRRYNRIEVLDYIEQYQQRHRGRSPSQRNISRALEMSAPSRANYAVNQLRKAGLLQVEEIERGLPLEFEITEAGVDELKRWRSRQQTLVVSHHRTRRGTA